jgi:hypothetical protein
MLTLRPTQAMITTLFWLPIGDRDADAAGPPNMAD